MKAVRIHQYGGLENVVYEDAPRPQPQDGEILIRVCAAGVNPIDWGIAQGMLRQFLPLPLPHILGCDVAGVVEESGSSEYSQGEEVFGMPGVEGGAFAEYIVLKAEETAHKPQELSWEEAAAIPVAATTAWQALFEAADLQSNQTVLVHAAAGGVGSFAVQLAKWKGARVIGTASAPKHEYLHSLGVDETIDYKTQRFEDLVHNVDVVIDAVGGETMQRSWSVLKDGGILVSVAGGPPTGDAPQGKRFQGIHARTDNSQLAQIADLAAQGKIKIPIGKVLPMSQAREALELMQSRGAQGKVVLRMEM